MHSQLMHCSTEWGWALFNSFYGKLYIHSALEFVNCLVHLCNCIIQVKHLPHWTNTLLIMICHDCGEGSSTTGVQHREYHNSISFHFISSSKQAPNREAGVGGFKCEIDRLSKHQYRSLGYPPHLGSRYPPHTKTLAATGATRPTKGRAVDGILTNETLVGE